MEYTHLARIVSAYPNSAVSRFALHKIRRTLLSENLATDEEIIGSLLICRKCSQKLIPGVNCNISIEGPRKHYKNCAVYQCNLCGNRTRFNGIPKNFTKYNQVTQNPPSVKSAQKSLEKQKITEIYLKPPLRTLQKQQKKTLLEAFFESSQDSSVYKIFH